MKIETKFNVGDVVTYIGYYNICSGTVTHITINVDVSGQPAVIYEVNKGSLPEANCFSSLQALLKHLETKGS